MKKSKLTQIIREEVRSTLSEQDQISMIQRIQKDMEDKRSELSQLDTPQELEQYFRMMIGLLSDKVASGNNIKVVFRKLYKELMQGSADSLN